ncbi:VOC family protein [Limnochorda pilosa]|uniref:VOC domain-containing protein n=1 Tax=Limnochorda pilosa TaxID=1555112 RepID=A0A0K2SIH5_LIMPI|nr:VOC family protein [Limnochorda pilosa]BAS26822.1 hypothetical protein LIP_0965 [Limnochorda pilosa]BAS26823.1 hypothetical protein LIP_0966 [Limnochorda pilosa]
MKRRVIEVARFTKQPGELAMFYADLLGASTPDPGRDAYSFDVEGVDLFIHSVSEEPAEPGWPKDVDHVAFQVEDLDAECERLSSAGYEVLGPTMFPWGRSAFLYDPDGRMVELRGLEG